MSGAMAEQLMILAPGLGRVEGEPVASRTERTPKADWSWLVVRLVTGAVLVVQEWVGGDRPTERWTCWLLPDWARGFEGRLAEARTVEEIRGVLGAGTAPATVLLDRPLGSDLEPEVEPGVPDRWELSYQPAEEFSSPVVAKALARARSWALRHELALEVGSLEVVATALAEGTYQHGGVGVMGWARLRMAVAVRYAGQPALLLVTVEALDGESLEVAAEQGTAQLALVPWVTVAEAESICLAQAPGFAIN